MLFVNFIMLSFNVNIITSNPNINPRIVPNATPKNAHILAADKINTSPLIYLNLKINLSL